MIIIGSLNIGHKSDSSFHNQCQEVEILLTVIYILNFKEVYWIKPTKIKSYKAFHKKKTSCLSTHIFLTYIKKSQLYFVQIKHSIVFYLQVSHSIIYILNWKEEVFISKVHNILKRSFYVKLAGTLLFFFWYIFNRKIIIL